MLVVLGLIIIACIIVQCHNRKNMTAKEKEENPGCLKGCLVFTGVFTGCAVIVLSLFMLFFTLHIDSEDVELNYNPNILAVGVDCNVTAKLNIRDLELEFTFYDRQDKETYTLKKYVGDINKGETKKVTISIFEIQSENIPVTCKIKISNGRKALFANLFSVTTVSNTLL